MHRTLIHENGAFHNNLTIESTRDILAKGKGVLWLDICAPDADDMALLREGFEFHPLAIEDATHSPERPKVDVYTDATPTRPCGSYYFLVFYAVAYNAEEDQIDVEAVNLFVGANYLVTVHRAAVRHIDDTLARWEAPDSPLSNRVSTLVHALLDALVDDYFPLMDHVADRLEDLEDTIFVRFNQQSIQSIFGLKKSLLGMRRVVAPERDVLNVLLRRQLPVFAVEDMAYLQDVYDHIVRVTDNVDIYRDLLSSALDSYLSLQSNNLNQIMKILTATSIVLMTDSLVAGIYGMNFRFMPELEWRFGYFGALGLMVVLSVGLITYFRHQKWL